MVSKKPSDITPRVDARIRELHAQGCSLRRIEETLEAEGIRVSYRRCGEVLKGPAKKPYVAPEVTELDPGAGAPLDVVRGRLEQVRGIVSRLATAVEDGEYEPSKWGSLAKLEADLAARLVALTPPVPPDPANDPSNIQARGVLHAHVLSAVEAVEARTGRMCPRCRKETAGR